MNILPFLVGLQNILTGGKVASYTEKFKPQNPNYVVETECF